MAKLSVLGTGGWGIALAMNGESCGMDAVMWSLFEDEVKALQSSRESRLLSGVKIPEDIEITNDLSRADNADITIIAVPSFAVRETAARLKSFNTGIIVNVAKGFEKGSMKCLSDVIGEELPGRKIVVLSGPSHAEEVARAVPTSVVVSSYDAEAAGYPCGKQSVAGMAPCLQDGLRPGRGNRCIRSRSPNLSDDGKAVYQR